MSQQAKGKAKVKKKGATPEKIEKNIKDVELKPELLKSLVREVPKMKVITPNMLGVKYNLRLGEAKKVLLQLAEKGLIKPVSESRRIKIYTGSAAS